MSFVSGCLAVVCPAAFDMGRLLPSTTPAAHARGITGTTQRERIAAKNFQSCVGGFVCFLSPFHSMQASPLLFLPATTAVLSQQEAPLTATAQIRPHITIISFPTLIRDHRHHNHCCCFARDLATALRRHRLRWLCKQVAVGQ